MSDLFPVAVSIPMNALLIKLRVFICSARRPATKSRKPRCCSGFSTCWASQCPPASTRTSSRTASFCATSSTNSPPDRWKRSRPREPTSSWWRTFKGSRFFFIFVACDFNGFFADSSKVSANMAFQTKRFSRLPTSSRGETLSKLRFAFTPWAE